MHPNDVVARLTAEVLALTAAATPDGRRELATGLREALKLVEGDRVGDIAELLGVAATQATRIRGLAQQLLEAIERAEMIAEEE